MSSVACGQDYFKITETTSPCSDVTTAAPPTTPMASTLPMTTFGATTMAPTTVPSTTPTTDCDEGQQDCDVETDASEDYNTVAGTIVRRLLLFELRPAPSSTCLPALMPQVFCFVSQLPSCTWSRRLLVKKKHVSLTATDQSKTCV